MPQTELLDIVNLNDQVTGQATRDFIHQKGDIPHRVVRCWVFNKNGQILWQQRSLQKKNRPGRWDATCGGHIAAGGDPDQTMMRELDEELGIKDSSPTFVCKYFHKSSDHTCFIYLFYVVCDQPVAAFQLKKDEIEQVEWIDIDKAMHLTLTKEREATDFIFSEVPLILQFYFKKHAHLS